MLWSPWFNWTCNNMPTHWRFPVRYLFPWELSWGMMKTWISPLYVLEQSLNQQLSYHAHHYTLSMSTCLHGSLSERSVHYTCMELYAKTKMVCINKSHTNLMLTVTYLYEIHLHIHTQGTFNHHTVHKLYRIQGKEPVSWRFYWTIQL